MSNMVEPFTLLVTPELDAALRRAQKEHYSTSSPEEMIRDLIRRGLEAEKSDSNYSGEPLPAAIS